VPIVILSAAALISLSIQQRYGRVIDRIRIFHEKLLTDKRWEKLIHEQLETLIKRGKLLRNAMFFLMLCILFALLTIVFLSVEILYGGMSIAVMLFFSLSLTSLFISVTFAIIEMFISYNAVLKEDERIRKI
jgi:ABC-type bacteriocin/lantibiotic exporter with double-glycine peptidase domain